MPDLNLPSWLTDPVLTLGDSSLSLLQIGIGIGALILGFLLASLLTRLLRNRLTKTDLSANAQLLLSRLVFYGLIAVVVVTGLSLLGIPITAFAFISGAIAIGVGFGAQNIINNFISGWILMGEQPIRIGDFIELADQRGTVEAINNRHTRIRRVDGVHILVPNSQLLESSVVNWTLIDRDIRTSVRVGVAYGSDVQRTHDLIEQVALGNDAVLKSPPPRVYFEDFGDSALIFDLFVWCQATAERDIRGLRSQLRFGINQALVDAGIVIAFPQRDVHIDGQLRLTRDD